MKLINKDTDYAVRALIFIDGRGKKITTVPELVNGLKVSYPFLRKILQKLNKEGLLKSFKGKGGGFKLAKKSDTIKLLEIIKIFQSNVKFTECLFKNNICPDIKRCFLKKKIGEIERYVISELDKITIATLKDGNNTKN